jgi:beta-glucuronidase
MLKPQTSPTRELLSLDGLWSFAVDSAVGAAPWSAALATPLEAAVPASYNDLFVDAAIRDHVGWVWYQRTVRVPRGWDGDRIFVRLDAATHEGVVYVDDTKVAEHVGGYTPFEADITDLVTAGQEFRLTVGVGNELTNTTIPPGRISIDEDGGRRQEYLHDFFNYAGLARSVWLYSAPSVLVS